MSFSASEIPVWSWIETLRDVAAQFTAFMLRPAEFAASWLTHPEGRVSPWILLGSSLTLIALCYACYAAIFRASPLDRLFGVKSAQQPTTEGAESKPRIGGFAWRTVTRSRSADGTTGSSSMSGFGFGIEFPEGEAKGLRAPQLAVFMLGIIKVVVVDVIPDSFTTRSSQTLFLVIYALISVLSTWPVAWLLGSTPTFGDTFDLTIGTFTFCLLYAALLVLLAALLVRELLRVELDKLEGKADSEGKFLPGCLIGGLWVAIIFVPLVRSLYGTYHEFYALSGGQMTWLLLGSAFLSIFVAPVVFIPLLYVWLKIKEIFETLI